MNDLMQLLAKNRAWAAEMTSTDPSFFQRLAYQQTPEYLWIGCSDSRVPATQLVGLLPGEMFVHRNVANVVVHTDLNCLSVLHYAVAVLHVRHIIVCGHYGCGGVQAALQNDRIGLIDNWLRHVQDVRNTHTALLATCTTSAQQLRLLCALNVLEQVRHVCETTAVQDAWEREQVLTVHGVIYDIADGLLSDLDISISNTLSLAAQYTQALARLNK